MAEAGAAAEAIPRGALRGAAPPGSRLGYRLAAILAAAASAFLKCSSLKP